MYLTTVGQLEIKPDISKDPTGSHPPFSSCTRRELAVLQLPWFVKDKVVYIRMSCKEDIFLLAPLAVAMLLCDAILVMRLFAGGKLVQLVIGTVTDEKLSLVSRKPDSESRKSRKYNKKKLIKLRM